MVYPRQLTFALCRSTTSKQVKGQVPDEAHQRPALRNAGAPDIAGLRALIMLLLQLMYHGQGPSGLNIAQAWAVNSGGARHLLHPQQNVASITVYS